MKGDTEASFQDRVINLAQMSGWLVHAERPARTKDGWRTPIQGLKGFPDLVLVRNGQMILAELKSQKGRLSPEQTLWIEELSVVGGITVVVWRPKDWESIVAILTARNPWGSLVS